MKHTLPVWMFALSALLQSGTTSHAVILYWTDRATVPPRSCYYVDSGWQYQGQWGSFLGTPIAPQYFITAKHVDGTVGNAFLYGGQSYTTTAAYASPASDLRIWKISGTFDTYAPLYTAGSELGQTMTVFGRGTARGSEVIVDGVSKGWTWGPADGVQSWGSNKISAIVSGGPTLGHLLAFDFDATGDWFEGHLSGGDSGGGVFIKDGDTWKLAGINYGVEGPYSLTGAGSGFSAAIFDQGGLYVSAGGGTWNHVPDQSTDIPATSYATRISSNLAWIQSIIGPIAVMPEPATAILMLLAAVQPFSRRRTSAR